MPHPQGAVVIASDPFGSAPTRPYLILSNDRHPFHGEEYIAAVVTTTIRDSAVELEEGAFVRGGLPRRSYVSPWNPVTLEGSMIDKHVATVVAAVVDDVVAKLNTYLRTP